MRAQALLVLLELGCAGSTAPATETKAQALAAHPATVGTSVADITLSTFPEAGKHSFSSDQGQVVVIDAWATWCAPCVRSLPLLQTLKRDYAKKGVRVYAVSVDEDRAQIPAFLSGAKVQLPVLLDPGGFVLESKLKLKQMPTTWVVDRTGHIRFTQESFDGNLDDLRAQVDAVLQGGQ
ncbi:MAG TPA: TlpA disulfide reductase family protein [Myxococcaceae bacterium]|nr:TlpA disulfide reductase family protein [Myxococcaceae bacterium]